MEVSAICRIILLFIAVVSLSLVQGLPKIVDPMPDNIYAIEFEKAQVSCTAIDADPNKKPDKIEFYRKGKFGELKLIADEGPSGRIYYSVVKKDNGAKLETTLHFNNVTTADDSAVEGYECFGFTGVAKHGYGFTVSVIKRDELPDIEVSKDKVVKFGDDIVLSCNLTTNSKQQSSDTTELSNLRWAKDGKVIDEVLYPKEQSLKSRTFKVTSPEDGGLYSCHLVAMLRSIKQYNITGNISVTVEPKYFTDDLKDNEIKVFKGKEARMECSAKGNPLMIEWKKNLKKDHKVKIFDLSANNTDYEFENLGKLEDQTLIIPKADYSHRGKYYCCIQSTNGTMEEDDVEGCQVFTLRVKDPLGPLWPVIGITIEVILLVLIIVGSEKLKKKKNQSNKTDGHVEFSYSSTDDNDKGQVRLRPSAAAGSAENA